MVVVKLLILKIIIRFNKKKIIFNNSIQTSIMIQLILITIITLVINNNILYSKMFKFHKILDQNKIINNIVNNQVIMTLKTYKKILIIVIRL